MLHKWREKSPGASLAFLSCFADGAIEETFTPNDADDLFKSAFVRSKWRHLRGWHVIRHSFISNCAAKNVDQRMIDEWVGHTTEAMRRRYRHLISGQQRQAIQAVFDV